MPTLFLLRHLKSQWNEENRFAGWTDGPLAKDNYMIAKDLAGKILRMNIEKIYSSSLFRNQDTIATILDYFSVKYPMFIHLDKGKMQKWGSYADTNNNDVPVFVSENLNERYYGKLQGLNKAEIINRYGERKVQLWRRSYNVAPPGGESLKDVFKRVIPFYKKYIQKDLKAGQNVLVVASHNSLRALAKYIENIPDKNIIDFEIPFGGLIKYELDNKLKLKAKQTL